MPICAGNGLEDLAVADHVVDGLHEAVEP